jgi:hypothetical protein
MSSGGVRANAGRVPDPQALRRDRPGDSATWTRLPVAGRTGEPPAWPLSRPTARERALWATEWRRPQALMWETNGQELEVALYVRSVRDAERPRATVASRTLVKQQQEALGLSLPGLLRLRWTIVSDDIQANSIRTPSIPAGPSTRDRLKLVVAS